MVTIKDLVDAWEIQPVTLAMFGSAARRDGSTDSDIDLLLVVPPSVVDADVWVRQRHNLADAMENWTGNRVQIYEIDEEALSTQIDQGEAIVAEWRREARTLSGQDVRNLLRRTKR